MTATHTGDRATSSPSPGDRLPTTTLHCLRPRPAPKGGMPSSAKPVGYRASPADSRRNRPIALEFRLPAVRYRSRSSHSMISSVC